jgi:hypothetical protein
MSSCFIGIGSFDAAVAYQIGAYGVLSALCLLRLAACSPQHAPVTALSSRRRR